VEEAIYLGSMQRFLGVQGDMFSFLFVCTTYVNDRMFSFVDLYDADPAIQVLRMSSLEVDQHS
jgi:hypothetical protein